MCRSEVLLSTLQKKNGNYVNEEGKILDDKISEHLLEDQEQGATLGVPLKILVHPMMPLEKCMELNILVVCVV